MLTRLCSIERPEGLPWQYGPSPGVPCKEGIPIAIQFGLSTPPPIVPPRPSGGPGAMPSSQPMSPSLGHRCSSGAVPQSQPTLPVGPARALSRPLPPPAESTPPPPPPYQLFGAGGASNRILPMPSTAEQLDIDTQNILRSGDNTLSGPSTPAREDTAAQYILR